MLIGAPVLQLMVSATLAMSHGSTFSYGRVLSPTFLKQRLHAAHQSRYLPLWNRLPIHLNALAEGDQVRRRKQADPPARRPIDTLEHCAGRTLAVGSRDMDKPQLF